MCAVSWTRLEGCEALQAWRPKLLCPRLSHYLAARYLNRDITRCLFPSVVFFFFQRHLEAGSGVLFFVKYNMVSKICCRSYNRSFQSGWDGTNPLTIRVRNSADSRWCDTGHAAKLNHLGVSPGVSIPSPSDMGPKQGVQSCFIATADHTDTLFKNDISIANIDKNGNKSIWKNILQLKKSSKKFTQS